MTPKTDPSELRSHRWYGVQDLRAFGHRSRSLQMGLNYDEFVGRPVIAILNSWSDLQPCHRHFRERAEAVKRGVWQKGGYPVELPVQSLSETFMKPTTMLYRNFLAMEAEEMLRAHPVDGAVLMGGCDKTTPALIMGAISAGLPAIFMPAGPMLRGHHGGKVLGSGSDVWKYWAEKQAGTIDDAEWTAMESGIARSFGTCMTMGTASTMTGIADTLGFSLPGASSIPAADSAHDRMAAACGKRIVDMVWEDLTPKDLLSPASFENALVVHMAMAGSTNAMIHLVAMARRAGIPLTLDDFDRVSSQIPVLADIRPSGRFLMEDFFYAGGLPALWSQLSPHLDHSAMTVTGQTLGDVIKEAKVHLPDVIRPLDNPVGDAGGTAILRGNIAPDGCVIKPAAADPRLLDHSGPALVFDDYDSMLAAMDDPDLDATADSVIILRNAGPQGGPGMPEWGMLPIPRKLLEQGVRDMIRISDCRMSGTSYGACILHVSPEAYIGGPLAAVKTGDTISVNVAERSISLDISDAELKERLAEWTPPAPRYQRGYAALHNREISQAHEGCDFAFLEGTAPTPEPEIH